MKNSILDPDDNISRQEVCAILSSIYNLVPTEDFTVISDFSDNNYAGISDKSTWNFKTKP